MSRRIGQPGRGNSGTRLWTFGPTTKLQDFFFFFFPPPWDLGPPPTLMISLLPFRLLVAGVGVGKIWFEKKIGKGIAV